MLTYLTYAHVPSQWETALKTLKDHQYRISIHAKTFIANKILYDPPFPSQCPCKELQWVFQEWPSRNQLPQVLGKPTNSGSFLMLCYVMGWCALKGLSCSNH